MVDKATEDAFQRVHIETQFSDNITEELKNELQDLAHQQAAKFTNSYFKKILKKQDAEIKISIVLKKNEPDGKFEGKFNASLDGQTFYWDNDVPFKYPRDVVKHAFDHLKKFLSDYTPGPR